MTIDEKAIKEALSVFGEKASMLVELTLKDANNFVTAIEEAITQSQTVEASFAAHSLKSIMRQIGAHQVADIAYEIEKAGNDNNLQICQNNLNPLKEAYADAKAYLEAL